MASKNKDKVEQTEFKKLSKRVPKKGNIASTDNTSKAKEGNEKAKAKAKEGNNKAKAKAINPILLGGGGGAKYAPLDFVFPPSF